MTHLNGAPVHDPSVTSDLDRWAAACTSWLEQHWPRRDRSAHGASLDNLSDDVAVFHSLSFDQEATLIAAAADWQASKFDAGFAAIDWPVELGGAGLSPAHDRVFSSIEAGFEVPADHELRRITTNLAAPTLRQFGTVEQLDRYVRPFLSCRETVCQLFSEPGAGSDLAGLSTRAKRVDDGWVVNGAKVWVSGAQHADWGFLIARSDPDARKHAGMTAFLVPMRSSGVEVRPIRQMTGGSSFNEVRFDGVRLDDGLRVGDVGAGWTVALAMLAFERGQSGSRAGVGGSWQQLLAVVRSREGRYGTGVRQRVVRAFEHEQVRELTARRVQQTRASDGTVGPEGSVGKLLWVQGMHLIGAAAAELIGPDLVADTGVVGRFAWSQHVLGAPGYRIAGGSDEIQRNIIGERVLQLPREPQPQTARHGPT